MTNSRMHSFRSQKKQNSEKHQHFHRRVYGLPKQIKKYHPTGRQLNDACLNLWMDDETSGEFKRPKTKCYNYILHAHYSIFLFEHSHPEIQGKTIQIMNTNRI